MLYQKLLIPDICDIIQSNKFQFIEQSSHTAFTCLYLRSAAFGHSFANKPPVFTGACSVTLFYKSLPALSTRRTPALQFQQAHNPSLVQFES